MSPRLPNRFARRSTALAAPVVPLFTAMVAAATMVSVVGPSSAHAAPPAETVAPGVPGAATGPSPWAGAPRAPDDAAMARAMNDWIDGERDGSVGFVGAGLLSLGGGALLLSREGGIEQGAGATFAIMGGTLTLFGVVYGSSLPGLRRDLGAKLAKDPAGYDREETARMQGIVDRFYLYRWAEIAIGATGVGLLVGGLAAEEDVVAGVGIGLASEASVLLVLDALVEARGHRYLEQLDSWKPSAAVGPEGAMVGVGRTF